MPFTPFFETLTECMRRNYMLPFQAMSPFRIFLGNVTVCVNNMFALSVLGFTVKSCLVRTVYLIYQDFFSFAERLNGGVAFGSCVD
jgi:hypothetical protein